ncbi:MAG: alpha/beta hydrolase [Bacteroidota bacterium]|nr:alpha/beta hydrolase [Bacteroidota bacterium]
MSTTKNIFYFFIGTLVFTACDSGPDNQAERQKRLADSIAYIDSVEFADSLNSIKDENQSYSEAYDKALKLWETPFEERDVKTSFGNAHIIISGPPNAKPLILLHGMNASSTMWYPNVGALSETYRVYAIDFLLEPGKSLCQGDVTNTAQIVNWYYEIFDQLKLNQFSIVGASRGGWLAINIALHSPKRIEKIALLSPAQAFTWIKPKGDVISNVTYSMNPKRKRLRDVLQTMTFNVDNISQVYINQYYIGTKEATISKCILQMTPFSDDQLKSLKMPVLVLIGDNDIINGDKSLAKARELIRNVETDKVSNAGHFLSFDQAALVNKRVLEFLNKRNPGPAKK